MRHDLVDNPETSGACGTLLCDNCRRPGQCCSYFGGMHEAETALEQLVWAATVTHGTVGGQSVTVTQDGPDVEHFQIGLPFMPLLKTPVGTWRWWCPVLGHDGRCSDYANRPSLCRAYQAGFDRMCAMHVAPAPIDFSEAMEGLDEATKEMFPLAKPRGVGVDDNPVGSGAIGDGRVHPGDRGGLLGRYQRALADRAAERDVAGHLPVDVCPVAVDLAERGS